MTNLMHAVLFHSGDITYNGLPGGFRKIVLGQVSGKLEDRARRATWQQIARQVLHYKVSLQTMVDLTG